MSPELQERGRGSPEKDRETGGRSEPTVPEKAQLGATSTQRKASLRLGNQRCQGTRRCHGEKGRGQRNLWWADRGKGCLWRGREAARARSRSGSRSRSFLPSSAGAPGLQPPGTVLPVGAVLPVGFLGLGDPRVDLITFYSEAQELFLKKNKLCSNLTPLGTDLRFPSTARGSVYSLLFIFPHEVLFP